jgi:hypothetical protein
MSEERDRMDCAEFRDVLHELDRPGTRGAAELDSAMTHAEGCGDCAVLLVEGESLNFGLRKVARETARMPGAARVEAELLQEFRKAKPKPVVMIASGRRAQWRIVALGVAAAVLLALGVVIHERNLKQPTVAPVVDAAANQSQSSEPSVAVVDNSSTASASASNSAADTAKQPSASNDAQETEYATAFVRLPYADDPAALEGGSVVRVTMARSVLESYGLPAEGMGTGDRVTADMLVSEDGTPQAIRLVAQED